MQNEGSHLKGADLGLTTQPQQRIIFCPNYRGFRAMDLCGDHSHTASATHQGCMDVGGRFVAKVDGRDKRSQ
jgi:hypothetical protein